MRESEKSPTWYSDRQLPLESEIEGTGEYLSNARSSRRKDITLQRPTARMVSDAFPLENMLVGCRVRGCSHTFVMAGAHMRHSRHSWIGDMRLFRTIPLPAQTRASRDILATPF